ncbi:hypothetical protein ACJO2E_11725 [Marinobacter sp. M1N3S26]|uniref:hypothetical protein n=1 Tax=unclassified Marinobacter TaxID=83889 RepID=UPI00387AD113
MQDRVMVTPVPSTVLHNAVELRRAYTRAAARKAVKTVARWIHTAQHRIAVYFRPNRPAAG